MEPRYTLARAILPSLIPCEARERGGLVEAIRTEMLLEALEDRERPRTLASLLHVLERISRGDVAAEFVSAVRDRAAQQPNLLLTQLATRSA